MGDLTKNFSRSEFACKCGCGVAMAPPHLLEALQQARDEIDSPIRINSGFRCTEHNKAVGGSEDSEHLTGEAVDLRCENSTERWNLLRVLPAYFMRVGIGKTFIHVGVAPTKTQRVSWLYE